MTVTGREDEPMAPFGTPAEVPRTARATVRQMVEARLFDDVMGGVDEEACS